MEETTFIERLRGQMRRHPDRAVFRTASGKELTYGQLDEQSNNVAAFLLRENPDRHVVMVYGHKSPFMLVCMVACLKVGCPYSPADISYPTTRINSILEQLEEPLVFVTQPAEMEFKDAARVIDYPELQEIAAQAADPVDEALCSKGDDISYILFTSGSTGKPKGVAQRTETLDAMSEYFPTYLPEGASEDNPVVVFNRVPFSFDVSVFDMTMVLPCGHTMFSLEEESEASLAKTFAALGESGLAGWVSTPSFLTMCLSDPSFNRELLPNAGSFVLCGEVLPNATCRKFFERFPGAKIYNTYGPTETQSMTDILVTPEMANDEKPIPIGVACPYADAVVGDRETGRELPVGEHGELFVFGRTLAWGYIGLPERTAKSFCDRPDHDGVMRRSYATGDEVYLGEDGLIHYIGRYDLQLKINGFRVELSEIEETLNGMPEVSMSCVVPITRGGQATALAAHIVTAAGVEGDRALTKQLKAALKETLPAYMIPRTFVYQDELVTNSNGKIDRKLLQKEHES